MSTRHTGTVSTTQVPVRRVSGRENSSSADAVAIEAPLEIRVGERPLAVTMRTPGDDFDLAAGFLRTESVIRESDDIAGIRHWGSPNIVRVALAEGVRIDWSRLQRHFYSTSSCGVCGKASIDAVRVHAQPVHSAVLIDRDVIHALPEVARARQETFECTGGIHAAALFTSGGELVELREDVGRHNAVDKVIGATMMGGETDLAILFVSGRAGFEVVQKAVVAEIPVVAAVGAPTSLAVELAREMNVTLIGFLRDERFNVYSGEERVRTQSGTNRAD